MIKRLLRITRVMFSRTGVRTVESFYVGNNYVLNVVYSINRIVFVA